MQVSQDRVIAWPKRAGWTINIMIVLLQVATQLIAKDDKSLVNPTNDPSNSIDGRVCLVYILVTSTDVKYSRYQSITADDVGHKSMYINVRKKTKPMRSMPGIMIVHERFRYMG